MNNTMPSPDSRSGLALTLRSVSQHGGEKSLTSMGDLPVDETTNIPLSEYTGIPSPVPRHITPPVSKVPTPEGSFNLKAQPVDDQQDVVVNREHLGPSQLPLHDRNNPIATEGYSSEEVRQPRADGEPGSNASLSIRSKIPMSRMVGLIIGALFLIVVPGLVVGVATKQTMWGIGLSGAITGVVTFFAGLYKYYK